MEPDLLLKYLKKEKGEMEMNKVLVIEDEMMTAKNVKAAFELNGIETETAENGEEGLRLVKEKDYDLILLDLKMPKMSGEEVLKEIRKIRPYVFVVIYTNFSDFIDIEALANIGIDGYVNKGPDADLQELVNIVKDKLEPFSIENVRTIIDNAKMEEE